MSADPRAVERIEIRISEPSPMSDYEVRIGAGLLDAAGEHISQVLAPQDVAVLTDTRVSALYGARIMDALASAGIDARLIGFASGEWNKTRESWAHLTDAMLRAGFGRDAVVVALGGGVVGDVAGFVAATYMRGVPVVQIPTTLLAMIDSSIGGKTGVDTPVGKNLVGAFHQPALVLVDPTMLASLSPPDFSSGISEVVKHGLILDAEYFEEVERDTDALLSRSPDRIAPVVSRSIELKAGVVGQDARERGYRQVLNFGHTVAHALEALSGYELRHGEAVAVGLLAESRIGEAMGVTEAGTSDRVRAVLEAAHLPVIIEPDIDPDRFFEAIALDKKARSREPRYTLLAGVGRVARAEDGAWTHAVPIELAREVLFGEGAARPTRPS